jgi:hypothetical protein
MRPLLVFALVLVFGLPTEPQQGGTAPSKDTPTKDTCLEKETSDFTRILQADGGRIKIGFLTEDITWAKEYRRAAVDVIQDQFSSRFVDAGDDTFGNLMLYISGTSVVSNGAQYVDIKLQLYSSELLLPENGKDFTELHLAKLGDPIHSVSGFFVFADEGVLLPTLEPGSSFELWQALRMQTIREKVHDVLAKFVESWDKAGKK